MLTGQLTGQMLVLPCIPLAAGARPAHQPDVLQVWVICLWISCGPGQLRMEEGHQERVLCSSRTHRWLGMQLLPALGRAHSCLFCRMGPPVPHSEPLSAQRNLIMQLCWMPGVNHTFWYGNASNICWIGGSHAGALPLPACTVTGGCKSCCSCRAEVPCGLDPPALVCMS